MKRRWSKKNLCRHLKTFKLKLLLIDHEAALGCVDCGRFWLPDELSYTFIELFNCERKKIQVN